MKLTHQQVGVYFLGFKRQMKELLRGIYLPANLASSYSDDFTEEDIMFAHDKLSDIIAVCQSGLEMLGALRSGEGQVQHHNPLRWKKQLKKNKKKECCVCETLVCMHDGEEEEE
jgi:hypothetical protein